MPWERMTDGQLAAFLEAKEKLDEMPGVQYIEPRYLPGRDPRIAIRVHLDPESQETLRCLPSNVEGLAVVAIVQDPLSGEVLKVVDLSAQNGELDFG